MAENRILAVACESGDGLEGEVSGHFGHSPFFAVAEVSGPLVVSVRVVPSPGHGAGGCSMPQFVRSLGAQALVVGGIGAPAAGMLAAAGIEVIAGISGNAGDALRALAAGTLARGDATCSGHGGDGHGCGHQHE
jgi:predicted Fe-Mo cluster-binding NifX family protein